MRLECNLMQLAKDLNDAGQDRDLKKISLNWMNHLVTEIEED